MSSDNLPTTQETSPSIPPEVAQILNKSKLGKEERALILRSLSMSYSHSGPLPDKDTITVYNKEIPNGGDRLMTQVENQAAHRISQDKKALQRSFNQSSTGQWMGFIIAILFGCLSWDLIKTGHDIAGGIIGSIDIVALVTVFIAGRVSRKDS